MPYFSNKFPLFIIRQPSSSELVHVESELDLESEMPNTAAQISSTSTSGPTLSPTHIVPRSPSPEVNPSTSISIRKRARGTRTTAVGRILRSDGNQEREEQQQHIEDEEENDHNVTSVSSSSRNHRPRSASEFQSGCKHLIQKFKNVRHFY